MNALHKCYVYFNSIYTHSRKQRFMLYIFNAIALTFLIFICKIYIKKTLNINKMKFKEN